MQSPDRESRKSLPGERVNKAVDQWDVSPVPFDGELAIQDLSDDGQETFAGQPEIGAGSRRLVIDEQLAHPDDDLGRQLRK